MTSSNGSSNSQNHPPSEKRDWLLMGILGIFNLGSGSTTILGAQQVLPKLLAWPLGAAVQLMLFLLLSGIVVKKAPARKWIAVLVFTGLSVYTSFFTYYSFMASEADRKQALDRAEKAHRRLVAQVYTPLTDRMTKLKAEAETLRAKADQEAEIGLTTGVTGKGPVARAFIEKAIEKENEARRFAAMVEQLRPKFEYEVEGLEPEEILRKDRQALAAVPPEYRDNYPELLRARYIDTELDISLLAPYYKVKRLEEEALSSLAIALLVDGMAIMLGTAITIKSQKKSILRNLAEFGAEFLKDFKGLFVNLGRAWKQPVYLDGQNQSAPHEWQYQRAQAEKVRLKLPGKGSEFLTKFYKAINMSKPHLIKSGGFYNYENQTFSLEFRTLVDKFGGPKRGWLEMDPNNPWKVKVKSEYYYDLTEWLLAERAVHAALEDAKKKADKKIDDNWGFSEVNDGESYVEISLPWKGVVKTRW